MSGAETGPVRIAMWSGPRNISTAMMRSFGARGDCAVTDEPFYGCYLQQSGEPQPIAAKIIADMNCDWSEVAAAMRGEAPGGMAVWYQKHMPHHMIDDVGIADFPDHRHAFLIREPAKVIASYEKKRVTVTFDDLRYDRQLAFFEQVLTQIGRAPPVIDSSAFLTDPAGYLRLLCDSLRIEWDPAMLSWPSGIRSTDGIWAAHWYDKVAASSGFANPPRSALELSGAAADLERKCRPFYEAMQEHALRP